MKKYASPEKMREEGPVTHEQVAGFSLGRVTLKWL
ncbi:hypothetical protein Psal071_02068 [Piscirickettsia salmonis]|uniref:Uncharacterized protein n=1 Tax=Piscirickettsia salmonis TaxID=1238 RepID=A0A9Q6LTA0_PISSA|nr:hypothetical protein KW89_1975 [Piscirickettsia salmonis]QGN76888.1 hypothetical protein Psal001_01080 [Piscirickettsia salmonis]QGN80478.1 hypothetical protein Psal002_01105 [Piscirickettsia salmonis]QGN85250.1 hypothetical protein Psal003_02327 [Piscirickettsia salmonis]QGN88756.1 hypothetical protein Psal004_02319 [Piscirickettsia salmonis]